MGKSRSDVLQGTLDLLILKTLSHGPQHGYGIAVHIQKVSSDALRVEEGSLYPALHRIEQDGWIRSEWGASDNNRRAKFYSITTTGRRRLEHEEKSWEKLTAGVSAVLRYV
jgi:PadR family transcriptional regulator